MPLAVGSRLGPYEIVSPLGAGGMGEVYRARDTKLGREIAIKILPELFVADPERIARFQREAQLLAALNHPHIAGIHGLEESDDSRLLVLELVDGETLDRKLRDGPLPLGEALGIARQIADALQAAHDKGIVHRDLKPANIALTADGQAKVLDFGLAKLDDTAAGASGAGAVTHSPTLSFAATQAGMILGTAAYMAPEQARGRVADKRSDIWAFGCVLFEMLSARKAFDGEDVTDVIAAVVRGEPDWSALPKDTPDRIREMIRRCLVKDRTQRIPDIAVTQYMMDEALAEAARPAAAGAMAPASARTNTARGRRWYPAGLMVAGVALGAAAAGTAAWMAMRPEAPAVNRFAIVPPPAQSLAIQGIDRDIAISRDGRAIVYRAGSGVLAVRQLDQLDAQLLTANNNVRQPFFSPDGHWIGFFEGAEMKKVSVTGGPAITLCRITGANSRGASWGDDNTIVFATADTTTGLLSVPAGGGEPKVLTKPDAAQHENDHWFPAILPGNRGVLYTIQTGQVENAQVAVLDFKTGERKTLIRGGSDAQYIETGHLVYAAAGTLRAVRFDVARLEVTSDPVPIVEHVMVSATGAANYAVSQHGTLVYVPGGAGSNLAPRQLVWVDRRGHEEPLGAPPRAYAIPRISPDGTRVALEIRDQENDIWIWDLGRRTPTRLTFDPGLDAQPLWTPDSRRVVFSSTRGGVPNLFWHAADGTGVDQRLTISQDTQAPQAITPDGKYVIGFEVFPKTAPDVVRWPLEPVAAADGGARGGESPPRQAEPLIQTTFAEFNAEISPNGRYLAYQSNESGQFQVYVRPYPTVNDGRWQISTAGGTRPVWSRDGRELFFLDSGNTLTSVPVQTGGSTFVAGNPAKVFEAKYAVPLNFRTYDVAPDGRRFLMIKEGSSDEKTPTATLVVVEHWFEELKARAASR